MREIIESFNTDVEYTNQMYTIRYSNNKYFGDISYKPMSTKGIRKPIRQKFYVVVEANMNNVVEYINTQTQLSGERLQEVNKLIRDHSLEVLNQHLLSHSVEETVTDVKWTSTLDIEHLNIEDQPMILQPRSDIEEN